MPKVNTLTLDTGDMFPHLEFDSFQGDRIVLPEYLKGFTFNNW